MARRRDPTGNATKMAIRAARDARKAVKSTKKARMVSLVKKVIMGKAETKQVAFYQSYNNGSATNRATGLYSDRGWATQNNVITSNNLDILQLIPFCYQGLKDNQRIGERIQPVSLKVNGCVRINYANNIATYNNTDLKVVIYVLQHVQLKDYTTLYAENDFSQLLKDTDSLVSSTQQFDGQSWQQHLPIANQYYRLLKKKVITLKYEGLFPKASPGGAVPTVATGVPNSHNYFASYSMNLSKYLPKNLKYPEETVTDPLVLNTPTNSSIFMAMGFFQLKEPASGGTFDTAPQMEQTYQSRMGYKDL